MRIAFIMAVAHFAYTMNDSTVDPVGGVSIFSSVQKLGLALEHRKMPVEHVVVDHAEKVPTEN